MKNESKAITTTVTYHVMHPHLKLFRFLVGTLTLGYYTVVLPSICTSSARLLYESLLQLRDLSLERLNFLPTVEWPPVIRPQT